MTSDMVDGRRITHEDVLRALPDGGEPVWAAEVADSLEAHRRTIQRRLNQLAALGRIERKRRGEGMVVYWRPEP